MNSLKKSRKKEGSKKKKIILIKIIMICNISNENCNKPKGLRLLHFKGLIL